MERTKRKRNYWKIAGIFLICVNLALLCYNYKQESKEVNFEGFKIPEEDFKALAQHGIDNNLNELNIIDLNTGESIKLTRQTQ